MQIKEKVLKSNPGTIQTYPQPTFKVTNSDKSVVGYYIYFGSNITIDPVVKGSFVKQLEYTPKGLKMPALIISSFEQRIKMAR